MCVHLLEFRILLELPSYLGKSLALEFVPLLFNRVISRPRLFFSFSFFSLSLGVVSVQSFGCNIFRSADTMLISGHQFI